MSQLMRFRFGLLAALFAAMVAVAYFVARPLLLSERTIRIALTEHLTDWTGATLSVSGPVRLSYFPRLQMELGNVRMAGIKHVPALREMQAERIDVRLGLRSLFFNDLVVDRVTLIEPTIQAHTGLKKDTSSKPDGAAAALEALARAPFDQIAIENGDITVTGPQTKEEFKNITARFNLTHPSGVFSSRGSFTWRGQTVSFRNDSGKPEKVGNALHVPIDINIGGDLVKAEIEGTATLSNGLMIDGNTDLRISNLPAFAKWTGVLVPDNAKRGAFSANGAFHWSGHRIGFDDGTFVLDGHKALGAVSLEFGGARPQIEGTLALQRLDLTQYFEHPAAKKASAKTLQKDGKAPNVEMDFPLLHHVNLDLRVSTTELKASRLSVGQSALSVSLKSGRLAADIAVFDFCGGNGNGRLEFDATVPDSEFRITTNLSNVSAQNCIGLFTSESPIEGAANVTADLTSKGRSMNELIASLGGRATLAITDGQVDFNAAKLLTELRQGAIKGWQSVPHDEVAFDELSGTLLFRRGGIYTDTLKVGLGPDEAWMVGAIELVDSSLDLQLKLSKGRTAPETQEKPTSDQTKLTPLGTIVIKGPWSEPNFRLEPAKSSAHLAPSRQESLSAMLGDHY